MILYKIIKEKLRKILFFTVIISLTGFSCGKSNKNADSELQDKSNSFDAALPKVVVIQPQREDINEKITIPGTLTGFEELAIYARITGYLEMIKVDIGDEVRRGETIARLEVPELVAQLEEAKAELAAARAKVMKREAELKIAQLTHKRLVEIKSKNEKAVTQQNIDESEANFLIAEAEIEMAKSTRTILYSTTIPVIIIIPIKD